RRGFYQTPTTRNKAYFVPNAEETTTIPDAITGTVCASCERRFLGVWEDRTMCGDMMQFSVAKRYKMTRFACLAPPARHWFFQADMRPLGLHINRVQRLAARHE